jgi:hypothetical protein
LQRKRKEDRKFESPHEMCNAPETIHNDPSLPVYILISSLFAP